MTSPAPAPLGAVVLAAGAGRRFEGGTPKPLARLQGETLVHRAARAALEAGFEPVVVVVGSQGAQVAESVTDLRVTPVANPAWEEGQSTSVRRGLAALLELAPEAGGALFQPCDQPHADAAVLRHLYQAARRQPEVVVLACHRGQPRAPSLFPRRTFEAGARQILPRGGSEPVPGEILHLELGADGALDDVDTVGDLARLEDRLEGATEQ